MAIYYVDQKSGLASDNNTGTQARPFLTIQAAVDSLRPGDIVYVKEGTYDQFNITTSGTAGNRIVITSWPGNDDMPIIDGKYSSGRGVIELRGQSHFEVSGFNIKHASTDGIFVEGSAGGERDIVIADNLVSDTGNAGIYVAGLIMGQTIGVNEFRLFDVKITGNEVTRTNVPSGGNEAISVGGGVDGFEISNNHVHDSEQYGIDIKLGVQNGSIHDNVIHGIEKHGIYVDSASRAIKNVGIYNNTVFDNNNGIVLARESNRQPADPDIQNINIFNNDVYDNHKYGIMLYKHKWDDETGLFDNVNITANDIHGNGIDGLRLVEVNYATNIVADGNAIYNNANNIRNGIGAVVKNTLNAATSKVGVQKDVVIPAQPDTPKEPDQNNGKLVIKLVDVDTDKVIHVIQNGDAIITNPAMKIGIIAEYAGGAKSITFDLNNGEVIRTENVVPFALFGDRNGDIFGSELGHGSFTLNVKAFSAANGKGSLLEGRDFFFSFTDEKIDEPVLQESSDNLARFTNIDNVQTGDKSDNKLNGTMENDRQFGGIGNDTLLGAGGDDELRGGNGNDVLKGHNGDDLLDGGVGDDILYGAHGNDILYGGAGHDALYGEGGDDIFVFSEDSFNGKNHVYDFDRDADTLDLKGLLAGYDANDHAITDFISITRSGTNSIVKVDVSGSKSFGAGTEIAVLHDVIGLSNEEALVKDGTIII